MISSLPKSPRAMDRRESRLLGAAMLWVVAGSHWAPSPARANPDPSTPIIRYDGQQGHAVWCIQFVLINFANQTYIKPDSTYGPQTRQGVINVQRVFGLPLDGEVGPRTGEVLKFLVERVAGRGSFGTCQDAVPTLT